MAIETTRRGFHLLIGTLAAAGLIRTEVKAQEKLQPKPLRFGYLIMKGGKEFDRFIEGEVPEDFEFEIARVDEVFAVSGDHRMQAMAFPRYQRFVHLWGNTYLAKDVSYSFEEDTNIQWLVVGDIEDFDPDVDDLAWRVGHVDPVIIRGRYPAEDKSLSHYDIYR